MAAPRRLACALILAAGSTLLAAGSLGLKVERAALTVTGHDLESHLRVLASDELEGRAVASAGNARAAEYVAAAFARAGAAPAGGNSPEDDPKGSYHNDPEGSYHKEINFEKLERIARLTFGAAWRVANAPAPPRYISSLQRNPRNPRLHDA